MWQFFFFLGILQLALLAQCNNIASSVITAAAAPSILAPKIKVIDENDVSVSLGSDTAKAGICSSSIYYELLLYVLNKL